MSLKKIDDILLLDSWNQFFTRLGRRNFDQSRQKAIIKTAIDLRFAMISYLFRKKTDHDGALGAEDIAELIKACQATSPKSLNHRQCKQLKEITVSINNLASVKESSNWKVHGREIYNFFWKGTSPESICSSIYHNILKICLNITESSGIQLHECEKTENFKPAKYLVVQCSKKLAYFKPLKQFENEVVFINLALRVIQLSCAYIIENPDPTLLNNQQSKIGRLLYLTNDLMISQPNIHPVRRTIELLMILNKLNSGNTFFKTLIQEINTEFFNGKPYLQKVGNSTKFKAHWKYNHLQIENHIQNSISVPEIIEKRNQIPFDLVSRHLKNSPENSTFFERFLNWFSRLFSVNKLQYIAPQYGYFKYPNSKLATLNQRYVQPDFTLFKI